MDFGPAGRSNVEKARSADEPARVVRFDVSAGTLLKLAVVVAGLWLLIQLWPVFLVLVVALLVVGTMSPAVTWMEGRGVGRGLGIAIAFTLLFLVTTALVTLTVPSFVTQAAAMVDREPAFRAELASYLALSNLTAPLSTWLRHLSTTRRP